MIDEPENTSSVTLSGERSARKIVRFFAFDHAAFVKRKTVSGKSGIVGVCLDWEESSMPLAMNREVFITCAVTGSGGTQDRSPHVPRSPKQIADSAIDAAKAGAAIVHCHVRDPETGKPRRDVHLYREVTERIRDAECRRGAEPHRRHGRRHGVRLAGSAAAAE